MNPLTHAFVTKRLIDEHNLPLDEGMCILGSLLPDLACAQAIDYQMAHRDSLGFIHYLMEKDPELVSVAYGMLLHSEHPGGVDKYTHGPGGFIEQHEMAMFDIVKKRKHRMHGGELKLFLHSLIEFSCDSFLTEREADLVSNSFRSCDLDRLSFHLAQYFNGNHKKVLKFMRFLKKFNWRNLCHVKGVAKTWERFQFYHSISQSHGLKLMKHIKGAFSLINYNNSHEMVEEARDYLRDIFPAYLDFLHEKISENLIPTFPKELKVSQRQEL